MSGDVILTEDDRGREVPVSVGDMIELHLPENATTGFLWALEAEAPVEKIEIEERGGAPAPPDAVGAAGTRVLHLRVLRENGVVRLRRGQEWNPKDPPDAVFHFTLIPR